MLLHICPRERGREAIFTKIEFSLTRRMIQMCSIMVIPYPKAFCKTENEKNYFSPSRELSPASRPHTGATAPLISMATTGPRAMPQKPNSRQPA